MQSIFTISIAFVLAALTSTAVVAIPAVTTAAGTTVAVTSVAAATTVAVTSVAATTVVTSAAATTSALPLPAVYTQTFANLTGATQASDFITFNLVSTLAQCTAACDSVAGCSFVNLYQDVNGKANNPLLTCSLYSLCHTAADATNTGGQVQPNGTKNSIANSSGFCKV